MSCVWIGCPTFFFISPFCDDPLRSTVVISTKFLVLPLCFYFQNHINVLLQVGHGQKIKMIKQLHMLNYPKYTSWTIPKVGPSRQMLLITRKCERFRRQKEQQRNFTSFFQYHGMLKTVVYQMRKDQDILKSLNSPMQFN